MSVIFFGKTELAEIISFVVNNERRQTSKTVIDNETKVLVNNFARYSKENAATYNYSYERKDVPCSKKEITEAVKGINFNSFSDKRIREIRGNAKLLRYNLFANDGKDFASKKTLDMLVDVLSRFIFTD